MYEIKAELIKQESGDFTLNSENNGGNYSICAENLGKGIKTLTLDYNLIKQYIPSPTQTNIEILDSKVRDVYFALHDISTNIEKLRTRETVHYESNIYI